MIEPAEVEQFKTGPEATVEKLNTYAEAINYLLEEVKKLKTQLAGGGGGDDGSVVRVTAARQDLESGEWSTVVMDANGNIISEE